MDHGLPLARRTRGRRARSSCVALSACLVLLMADLLDAVERVILPLPPPIQGALAAGPYNFQFTGEDFLRVSVVNSLTGVRVRVAYRTAPSPATTQTNETEIVPTSDRVVTVREFSVGVGYLLNVAVFAVSGGPSIGQTFAKIEVIRGQGASARVLGVVVADYLTANQPVAWPGSPIRNSLESDGFVRSFTGTDPAAGNDWSETVPTGARWELIAVRAALNTNATVINRYAHLRLNANGATLGIYGASAALPASTGVKFNWGAGLPTQAPNPSGEGMLPFPMGLRAMGAYVIASYTGNLQAGDDWDAPIVTVREWLEVN